MEDIIGILFYDSFIELQDQTKYLGKSKNSFNAPGHVKRGEKNTLHTRSQRLCEIAPHERHFFILL